MVDFNKKDEVIFKLYLKGIKIERIAKRLGLPDTQRVIEGLERKGIKVSK